MASKAAPMGWVVKQWRLDTLERLLAEATQAELASARATAERDARRARRAARRTTAAAERELGEIERIGEELRTAVRDWRVWLRDAAVDPASAAPPGLAGSAAAAALPAVALRPIPPLLPAPPPLRPRRLSRPLPLRPIPPPLRRPRLSRPLPLRPSPRTRPTPRLPRPRPLRLGVAGPRQPPQQRAHRAVPRHLGPLRRVRAGRRPSSSDARSADPGGGPAGRPSCPPADRIGLVAVGPVLDGTVLPREVDRLFVRPAVPRRPRSARTRRDTGGGGRRCERRPPPSDITPRPFRRTRGPEVGRRFDSSANPVAGGPVGALSCST